MIRRASGFSRLALVAGLGFLVVAGAGVAGLLVLKSQRTAYVKETLDRLGAAEQAHAGGRFADAVTRASDAVSRLGVHATWFETSDQARIRETEEFLKGQAALWTRIEAGVAGIATDPAKARADLESLAEEARRTEARSKPLIDRLEPHLRTALNTEREKVEAAAVPRIPEARQAYEEGSWDALFSHLEAIRKSIGALPAASREAAARTLEKDLKPVEELAGPVASMRAILEGKDDGPVKADRLRELIRVLPELKGRDRSLHRELLKSIATVDPETRKPVAGLALPAANHAALVETFSKGAGLENVGRPDDRTVIELQGPASRYAIRIFGQPPQVLIEVDRVRLLFPINPVDNREAASLVTAAELSRALRASRHPRTFADEAWTVRADAPGLCALNVHDKAATILLNGRLYEGTVAPEGDGTAARAEFLKAARALEAAVKKSAAIPEDVKGPVAALIKASHSRAPPADHLDGKFCREAVHSGYVEAQIGQADETVVGCLKDVRRLYGEVQKLRLRVEGRASDGATAALFSNLDGDGFWRVIDPATNTTTFSTTARDCMGSMLTAVSVFDGRHEEFPVEAEPVEVRMAHGVAGVVSRWSAATGKLEFDPARWALAVTLGEAGSIPEHFNTGDWQIPPHALKVDARGQARELILPAGNLKVESFEGVPAGPARRAAQDKFLKRCSEVLRAPGEFHLVYRYFVQYVLDSPVTTATTLVGSSRHCGDAHQDAYQTLDRRMNGRFLTDCDDLAELYWTILRMQNRAAFVLGVPGHATCGVAEKDGDTWTFFCVDTGPARQLKGADLDATIEKLLRTYDQDGSMSFDPRQMRFLFRFGGEQTRGDFMLDSRILRDPEYADLMIRVQEYWHFGFYALGIETMSKVLETDRMPANCQEIAGLYTRVGQWEDALKWTEAGIKGLEARDLFTGLSESMRKVQCLRELKRKDDVVATLKSAAVQIAKTVEANPEQADRYRSLKFQVAAMLAVNDLPWDGWNLVGGEVIHLVEAGAGAESLMSMVTGIYAKMRDAQRSGAKLTEAQDRDLKKVGEILEEYHAKGLFKGDDSNLDLMRKGAQLFAYYVAVDGPKKAAGELVKPATAQEGKRPSRRDRPSPEEDWSWIRLSPYAYAIAAARALDKDDATAGGPAEAVAVIRAMEAALPETRKVGSLGPTEFVVLDLRLLRACLEMDDKGIRGVFDEMKRQGWGELFENLARTLGGAAPFMKVEDFEKVFRIFCEYQVPRRHYYGVVYAASASEARGHALAASKICLERFPNDADMKREHALLEKLAR